MGVTGSGGLAGKAVDARSDGVGRGSGRIPGLAKFFSQKYSKFFSRDVTGSLTLKIRNRYRLSIVTSYFKNSKSTKELRIKPF